MKKIYGFAIAAVCLGTTAVPVRAVEPEAPQAPMRGAEMRQQAPQALSHNEVTGSVAAIAPRSGLITVASAKGPLKLHFPPQALTSLKVGDPITVEIALAKSSGSPSQPAYDAPSGLGEHRMTGTVTKVDPDTDWVHVKTEQTTLEFPYPAQAGELKIGDRITIDLAFSRQAKI